MEKSVILTNLLLFLISFCEMIGGFCLFCYWTNFGWIRLKSLEYIFQLIGGHIGWSLSFSYFLLLTIHRFKVIKYPYDQNEIISIKKVLFISLYTFISITSRLLLDKISYIQENIKLIIFSIFSLSIVFFCFIFLVLSILMINSQSNKKKQIWSIVKS